MESKAYEDLLRTLVSVQSILLFPETQVSIRILGRRADPESHYPYHYRVGLELVPRDHDMDTASPFKRTDIISMILEYKAVQTFHLKPFIRWTPTLFQTTIKTSLKGATPKSILELVNVKYLTLASSCEEPLAAIGIPVTMPQEEMPMEVLGKKFYVKEYGVGLKRSSSKRSSAESHDEVRVLKNQVETLKDMCQEQKNQFETLKDLCQTQRETIHAYDEKFVRFDVVMSAYMQGGLVGEGSNSRHLKT